MSTPHIEAPDDAFASTVLMPGDPLRARHIAENYLDNPVLVTAVRGIEGYTGTYEKTKVSVMASGMGVPSISIYATELYRHYAVERIMRVGTCGAILPSLKLYDIIVGLGACTDSSTNRTRFQGLDYAATASYEMVKAFDDVAFAAGAPINVGNIFTSDLFYSPNTTILKTWTDMGVLAVEMEAAGLYGVAAEEGKQALAVMTVSDHLLGGEELSSDQRQKSLDTMFRLSLETAKALSE